MKKYILFFNVLIMMMVMMAAYGQSTETADKKHIITVWFNAGLGNALKAMELNIEDFHKAQETYEVEMTLVPEGAYTDRILAAGQTGDLPDLLFFDGPMVAYLAWLGYLQPIYRFVSEEMKRDFLPSIIAQGTYNGQLYTLGIYDSGLARIPPIRLTSRDRNSSELPPFLSPLLLKAGEGVSFSDNSERKDDLQRDDLEILMRFGKRAVAQEHSLFKGGQL